MASNQSGILAFDFPHDPSHRREDFFVSPSNRRAYEAICRDDEWPGGCLVLAGPPRSGKTHLLKVWTAASAGRELGADELNEGEIANIGGGARIAVDGADAIVLGGEGEESLLHLCNMLVDGGGRMLVTSRTAPSRWKVKLPDLRSRLEGFQVKCIEEPDDTLLAVLLTKLFADRQISVAPRVVRYIIPRMQRSHLAAHDIVDALDELSFVEKGRINLQMAATVLQCAETDGGAGK